MKSSFSILAILICIPFSADAQPPEDDSINRNGLYAELYPFNSAEGLGLISVNYEYIFNKKGMSSLDYKLDAQEPASEEANYYGSAGFGILELFNLGFGLSYNNYQGGIRIGTVPAEESLFSFSADFYYHFGGYSEKSGMKPWFGRAGIQYFSEEGETYYDKMTFLNPRIGRKFFFSEKAGFEIDVGMMILLAHNEYYETRPIINFDMSFFPGLSLSFFYQFASAKK